MKCSRCTSPKNLEEDHIIPKSRGRDNILQEINNQLSLLGTEHFNSVKFSMWIMRLGVLEAFNTPEKIKERGTYVPYWDVPTTHYAYWYPEIKLANRNRLAKQAREKTVQKPLFSAVK